MNLSELKENAQAGFVNPQVIEIYLKKLVGCRMVDLIDEPTAITGFTEACAREQEGFDALPIGEREEKLRTIRNAVTLGDFIELIAKHCGGNILRPYLGYLNISEEKLLDFRFPQDVQHRENPEEHGFEAWLRNLPYTEPDYFTDYEEEQVVYNEVCAQPDEDGSGLTPTYLEAPAAPLPSAEPPKEPLFAALDFNRTFDTLNSFLPLLVFTVILGRAK